MRVATVAGLVVLLGCGSKRADTPAPAAPAAATDRIAARFDPVKLASRLARARAFVLGDSRPRDYRSAAAIYDELCAGGCGDPTACRELLDLAIHERGTVMTPPRVEITARLCDAGDQVACWVAAIYGMRDPATVTADLPALCRAGDLKACEAEAEMDFGTERGPLLARPIPLATCLAGVARGCASMFAAKWSVCAAHQTAPGAACVEEAARDWQADGGDPTPLIAAWLRVQALCTRGDADACEWVPGHEISDLDRCEAGDYDRCARLSRQGDAHAAELACVGGITEQCTPSRPRPSLAAELTELRDRCTKGDQTACRTVARRTAIAACPP